MKFKLITAWYSLGCASGFLAGNAAALAGIKLPDGLIQIGAVVACLAGFGLGVWNGRLAR